LPQKEQQTAAPLCSSQKFQAKKMQSKSAVLKGIKGRNFHGNVLSRMARELILWILAISFLDYRSRRCVVGQISKGFYLNKFQGCF
jgi:hypothetical protein